MPAAAVGLLLAAAVAHATWNFLAKGATGTVAFTFAFTSLAQVVYLPLAIVVLAWTGQDLGPKAWLFMGVSGALNLVYFVLLIEGYRTGDLSLVYPLARGTGPALAVVGAIVIFSERPSALALVGAALVVGGILVMSLSPHALRSAEATRSVAFALATGLCIATYTLWDNEGVSFVTPVVYNYGLDLARALLMAPIALATPAARAAVRDVFREQTRAVVGVAVLAPGAYIMVLAALRLAPVSYVAPAREVSILIGALLGLRLLGEGDAARRLAGAAAIAAGVSALALG
ncbi:MAG TPA: EamA family transporter [Dehalococcoidia bacterium]|nr:EamA family transporter [Dehalococcoidia bacterium]